VARAARRWDAALAAAPLADTIKRVHDDVVRQTLDRTELYGAQTPQGFRHEIVWEALRRAQADGVHGTDEAQLVERLGVPVRIVRNDGFNPKLTTPEDFRMARLWAGGLSRGRA
jgi:2-C-methyl-D-erythritol 4-phosphate cytidylyltransferase